jgi:hypothetical protein
LAAVFVVPKPLEEGLEEDEDGRELSVRVENVEPGRGVGGLGSSLADRLCVLAGGGFAFGGGISWELLVPELNEEPDRDGGPIFSPSMLCRPNPRLLLCSIRFSISSRSFSLFRLSAIRSLKDLIFGTSDLDELERASPPPTPSPGRLRLTSCALRPLSMPKSTRAGLLGSLGARRSRTGEWGTSTNEDGRGRSPRRMEAAVSGRDEMPWLSESSSSDALRARCSALSFSFASIACSFNCNVSSSSSSSSSCCGAPRDMGRRFEGDGDTEVRSRCCSYLRRPDGELKNASTGDCGGQLGWFVLTTFVSVE